MSMINNLEKTKLMAIVPAAGIGTRMNSPIAKQYIKLGSLTVLEYTLDKLLTFPLIEKIIVVLHPNDSYFQNLSVSNHKKIHITYGGENRSDSVLAGLKLLDNHDWVLVHDAARPCILHSDINKLVNQVLIYEQNGGILATKVTDTIKRSSIDKNNYIAETCDRSLLWAAATPQMFNVQDLRDNLSKAITLGLTITDEASAMELAGKFPKLIECRRDNIKITRQEDLALAAFFLKEQGYYQE